jgi:hypothetical protein
MLLERAELWKPRDGRAFKTSPWGGLVMAVLFAGGTAAVISGAIWGTLGWMGWVFAVPFGLFALLMIKAAGRSFGAANWVLIVKDTGLAVKIRSHLNSDLPHRDPVVAWIPREEIRAVRRVDGSRKVMSGGQGSVTRTVSTVALDILLTHQKTEELAAACKRERSFRGEGRAHFNHYPVLLPEPGVIRIPWGSQRQGIRPGIAAVLELLRESYPLEAELTRPEQDWRVVEGKELDDLVLELVEAGDKIGAVKLLRLRAGMSLSEARRFVDELLGRNEGRAA